MLHAMPTHGACMPLTLDVQNAHIVLVTSAHGAQAAGRHRQSLR
jgi:hypothetical protein